MKSVGIEITPQFIHGALLDVASQSLFHETVVPFPSPIHQQAEFYAEVNPSAVVQAILATINALCEPIESDVEIWISGRAGGLILADESGRAKTNFISWSDRRAQQQTVMNKSHLDRLADQWSDPKFDQLRRELHASSMLAMLYTMADNGTLPDGVLPLTIHDFFISHLCQQPGTMHCTLGVGLLDFQTNDWFYKALERAGLGDLWLPEITLSLDYVGRIKSGKRSIYFRPPVSELQAKLLGNQFSSKEISLSLLGNPRISAIQYGNGALSRASIPYFQQQRLITTALNEQFNIETDTAQAIPLEKCDYIAEQSASVAASFIHLDRFESILIAGCPTEASHRVAEAFSKRFQKSVRMSEPTAGLKGLLKLAQIG